MENNILWLRVRKFFYNNFAVRWVYKNVPFAIYWHDSNNDIKWDTPHGAQVLARFSFKGKDYIIIPSKDASN